MNSIKLTQKNLPISFNLRSNNTGAAYVLALTCLLAGLMLAITLVDAGSSYFMGESSRERKEAAANLAEGGIDYTYWEITKNGKALPYGKLIPMGAGSIQVNAVNNGSGTIMITSTGIMKDSRYTLKRVTKSQMELIVDNTSGDFKCSANWQTATSSPDKYASNYRWRNTQAISDMANWLVYLPRAGYYDVYAWWPKGGNRSTTAPYTIYYNGGTATAKANQQVNGGKWNLLGRWNFKAGTNSVKLSCWAPGGFVVAADAIRWVGPY